MKKVLILSILINFTFITFAEIPQENKNIVTLNISPRTNPTGELFGTICINSSYLRKYRNIIYFGGNANMNFHAFLCTFDCALVSNNFDNNPLGGEFRIGLGVGKYHYWINESNYNLFPVISSSLTLELGYPKIFFRFGIAFDSDFKLHPNSLFAFGPSVGIAVKF